MASLGPCYGLLFLLVHFHLSSEIVLTGGIFFAFLFDRPLRKEGTQSETISPGAFPFSLFSFCRILGSRPDPGKQGSISKELTCKNENGTASTWIYFFLSQ